MGPPGPAYAARRSLEMSPSLWKSVWQFLANTHPGRDPALSQHLHARPGEGGSRQFCSRRCKSRQSPMSLSSRMKKTGCSHTGGHPATTHAKRGPQARRCCTHGPHTRSHLSSRTAEPDTPRTGPRFPQAAGQDWACCVSRFV